MIKLTKEQMDALIAFIDAVAYSRASMVISDTGYCEQLVKECEKELRDVLQI